jgi:hypothetical protein
MGEPTPSWSLQGYLTPGVSGGGGTTPDLRLSHRAANELCPPVRCKPWLGSAEALRSILGRLNGLLRQGQSNQTGYAYWTCRPSSIGTPGH